ncbi:growth-regulating factor 2-like isoform X2 [Carex rostrata]
METVGIGEKRKAWYTSLPSDDGSLYTSNWKRGLYSFPSGAPESMGTPFTRSQWLELQRQALIYKHITASVPVPPYLLVPFHYTNAPYYMMGGTGALVNLGYLVNSNDPEPRRCRRTDGKKWRCSKDAAPDQKYCERHMHRGKPRSRKPVESPKSKALESTTAAAAPATNTVSVAPPVVKGGAENSSWNYMGFSDSYGSFGNQADKSSSQLKYAGSKPRFTEAIPDDDTCKQQHQHHNSLNLNFANIKDYNFSLLDSDLGSINDKPASMPDGNTETRGFIDAWSAEKAATLTSSNSITSLDLPHSGLSLSLPNDQINLQITDPLSSMQSPVTWTNHGSSLCGPLGEFFQPHQQQHIDVTEEPCAPEMPIDLWSKVYNRSNKINPEESPTRPVVLSPTGVLQKTASYSDNSNTSSPSFVGMGPAIYHRHVFSDFK